MLRRVGKKKIFGGYLNSVNFILLILSLSLFGCETDKDPFINFGKKAKVQAESSVDSGIIITWKNIQDDAEKINIDRRTIVYSGNPAKANEKSRWETIATLSPNESSFIDSGASCGATYEYRVGAVDSSGAINYTKPVEVSSRLCAPKNLAAVVNWPDNIELTWSYNGSGVNFEVYRKAAPSGRFELIATTDAASYEDSDIVCETHYIYYVRAVSDNNESGYSNAANAFTPICNTNPSILVDCPNEVLETASAECLLTASDTDIPVQALSCALDATQTTCVGATVTNCDKVDVQPQGEAAGPGACVVSVIVTDDYNTTGAGSDSINVQEDNLNPTVAVSCPDRVLETESAVCSVSVSDPDLPAQGLTCALGAATTCLGASITGCGTVQIPPQGEAAGPGSCAVAVNVVDDRGGAGSGSDIVNIGEVNQSPYWTTVPSDINIRYSGSYDAVIGAASDADLPNSTAGDPGNITCETGNTDCSFPVNVTGFGSGAASCRISFTGGPNEETCLVEVKAKDGFGATITKNIYIDVYVLDAISPGAYYTCALTTVGGVKCWGAARYGLWPFSLPDILIPTDAAGLTSGVAAISMRRETPCVLTTTGGMKCVGYNRYGQIGDNTTTNKWVPVDVVGLSNGVSAISAAGYHNCALTTTGGVKCWGYNNYGELGDNTLTQRWTPVDVVGLTSGVAAISAGQYHTCALTTTGGVKCWGNNIKGQLGDNSTIDRLTPVDVVGLSSGVAAISAGWLYTCALTITGGVKCWGYNWEGQLGDNTRSNRLTPVNVVGLSSGVVAISGGGYHACVITTTGGVKCWGQNDSGQVGAATSQTCNTLPCRLTPIDVVGLSSGVAAISAGNMSTCAITTTGRAKCWGRNDHGQVGDGTLTNRFAPVDVIWP